MSDKMYEIVGGVAVEMSAEKAAEYKKIMEEAPAREPTPEERLTKLEEENAELRQALEILLGDGKAAAK